VDEVYNLACPASPVHYQFNPVKTVKTCVLGTIHMLGLARRVHARILQASTSEIYGDPQQHPQSETYWGHVNPIGPRSCYDEGKRVAETLVMDYHRQNGMDVRIARIFNTFGPRMRADDGRVVSNFIVQALRDEPITIYGDGKQTRAFCFVSDMVDGLVRLMGSDYVGPVNLGHPGAFTILELAEKVQRLSNSRSQLIFAESRQDDPVQRDPDISLARRILQWDPKVAVDQGLRDTVAYFRNLLQAA
jgi:UDP-glucuronate decarboxylase